jgi:hypothetical protein
MVLLDSILRYKPVKVWEETQCTSL